MGYYKDDDDAKLRSMKSQALSFKKPKWEDEPEKEFERGKEFGMLPQELRHKDVYTKDDVSLILKALGKQIDESGNYRIYNLEHFLGIHKEN